MWAGTLRCSCRVPRHDHLMKSASLSARCCNWLGASPDMSTDGEKSFDSSSVVKDVRLVMGEKLDSSWQSPAW